jgi:hypothetical protein
MDFKSILKEQFKDLITEETLTAVHEAFEQAVNEKAEQKTQLAVEVAVTKIDEDHATKLEKLIESIDADHTSKLQKLVETIDFDHAQKLKKVLTKIDEEHTQMLQQVVSKYETTLKEEAETFRSRLVDEISNYMDLYLEKVVPTSQVNEAVENIRSRKVLDEIRKLVGINEEFINGEIKDALVDGKTTIDSLKKELNEALEANTVLNAKLNNAEAKILLEEKTKDMPDSTKAYVSKLLRGKSPEYIQENYQYVVEMFEKETSEQVENAKEKVTRRIVEAVDRPETEELVQESISTPPVENQSPVGGYLNEMKKLDGSKLKLKH